MVDLGQFIKNIRMERSWTQIEFAQYLKDTLPGISQSRLSNWESNKSIPNFIEMCLFCKKVGISLDDVMEQIRDDYRCAAVLDIRINAEPPEVEEDGCTESEPHIRLTNNGENR